MTTPVDKAIDNAIPLAIGAAIILGVAYFLLRKTIKETADAAAGLLTGKNAITENATDASGEKVTAYEGAGVAGTLGATANAVSGGVLASIGGWLGSLGGDDYNEPRTYYRVKFPDGKYHAVGDTWVDSKNQFSFEGKRYKLGTISGEKVATLVG